LTLANIQTITIKMNMPVFYCYKFRQKKEKKRTNVFAHQEVETFGSQNDISTCQESLDSLKSQVSKVLIEYNLDF
jgi:hypothetical protein